MVKNTLNVGQISEGFVLDQDVYKRQALSEADLGQIKEELTASGYVRRKFTKKKVKLTNKPMHYISCLLYTSRCV